ncbi:MAG: hypothetical protein H7329_19790 [Opitutaceae bacterium]|nr:hypothetical protein [Cytophagales bacterium]
MSQNFQKEILENLNMLDEIRQERVLAYIKSLYQNANNSILNFAGKISQTDLKLINEAINNGCGNIEHNEW